MSIEQNPSTNDLLQVNPNRSLFNAYPSVPFPPSSTIADPISSDEASDDQPSRRKVKFLCSFGGKILRRPSDGALRYAGGQTRIIAVRRDVTLPELYRKMADAYGGPVAIRYQLPDEDMDALVTVSTTEDLDNMMDEYDKLAECFVDGSAKLRIFLFSQVEIASVLAENISSGHPLIDPYDSGKKYIDAVNGGVVSEANAYGGEVRLKGRTASSASIHNSDAGFEGPNNEGTPTVPSPSVRASAFSDPSNLALVNTASSVPPQETQYFPAISAILGQTIVAAHHLNPPQVSPYPSQAFVESHQVNLVPPHSLNVATDSLMVNAIPVPQHPYLPPMTPAPASMPTQVGSMKPVPGQVNPLLEESQFSGTFSQPVPDPNCKVYQQPLSQIPPLQPSRLQPPSVEQYELHLVPPLPKGPRLRFEDCQLCQKSLPHVHSDLLINELGNVSGISEPNAHQILRSHHSDDVTWLQGQTRVVSAAMMDSLMEPNVELTVNPDQNGTCGVNRVPDSVLNREKFFMPIAENIDQSKLVPQVGTVGLPGDTQASHGVPPLSHLEASFHQQRKQVLHGETFHPSKFLHPTATFSLSESADSNGVYFNPQNHHGDYLQQLNILPDVSADYNQALRSSGIMGLSRTGETSYGLSLRPLRPNYDESLSDVIVPPLFPVNQVVNGKPCSRDYPLNTNYNAMECLSQAHGDIKQFDGITMNTFDILRSKEPFKPTVDVSKNTKPESLFMVGDSQAFRPQNGENVLLSSSAFNSPAVGPQGVSIKSVNPTVSNSGISREIEPGSSSVVGEENNAVNLYHGGSKLPSSNAFVSPGLLPNEYLVNPLLPTTMDLHIFELANTSRVSTIAGTSVHTQNFEGNAIDFPSNQRVAGMSPYISDSANTNTVIKGTGGVWGDEICQVKHFVNGVTAQQQANAPVALSSSTVLAHDEQFQVLSASFLSNENQHETLESMHTHQPRAPTVGSREPTVSGDILNVNHLTRVKVPDIEVLLEEGTLQHPKDWLMKDSRPDPVMAMKESGAHFIKQNPCDLAKQDGELVPQSSISPASLPYFSGSKDLNPPFLRGTGLRVDESSATIMGDLKIKEIKVKHSDKLHMGLPTANDIGKLQIIKNCDLEELRELGSGTFGTVYHGKWRGSDVAIKRINDRCFAGKPSEQEKMKGDFWNEASKLADLHHPNVVAFYGVVLDGPGGSYATVTEYMINGSLRNVLQRNDKTFDRRLRLLIAMDVAFGMEYLHGKNIVHFDLKSDNLLVNLRDPLRPICKVGDLGLSKVKCQTLISGGVRGTLPWMAPELLNGSSNLVSDKVDVFSFGIVMWELLTGEEPYSDLHYGTIIGGIVSNTLRPPVPESCDPDWRALMEQCWSAEPSERPSFTGIANRLRAMAGSLPQKSKAAR